jgi:ankyrin repeat protein
MPLLSDCALRIRERMLYAAVDAKNTRCVHDMIHSKKSHDFKLDLDFRVHPVLVDSTPLTLAARIGHKDIMIMLLQAGAHPDRAGKYGVTPLHFAAAEGHVHCVDLLLKVGANPRREAYSQGLMPHMLAALHGNYEVLQRFAQSRKIDVFKDESGEGRTAIRYALRGQHPKIVEYLQPLPKARHLCAADMQAIW